MQTDIYTYNTTRSKEETEKILNSSDELIFIVGVHVPGKYLSAMPGTLAELAALIKDIKTKKILTGPVIYGTQLEGGRFSERIDTNMFNEVRPYRFTFEEIAKYAIKGAEVAQQIKNLKIIEIETGRGCNVGRCSFCTEPLKNKTEYRKKEDIVEEVKAFYKVGERFFRLGKQTCFYSFTDPIGLLKDIRESCPDIEVLHIDNVNPVFVIRKGGEDITKALIKYGTDGNVAAFGCESFDGEVVKANTLNSTPETSLKAIELLNRLGKERGERGLPRLLPGINILFGLAAESKQTHEKNMAFLKNLLEKDLWVRRINIRQVALFPGTMLFEKYGNKFLRKNKQYYWKWRNQIRQEIDFPMLQKIFPKGLVMKRLFTEIHDGNTTFARQPGSYPIIVGTKERLPLKQWIDVEITDHQLRSLTGKVVKKY